MTSSLPVASSFHPAAKPICAAREAGSGSWKLEAVYVSTATTSCTSTDGTVTDDRAAG